MLCCCDVKMQKKSEGGVWLGGYLTRIEVIVKMQKKSR